jgi:hypothetical protein
MCLPLIKSPEGDHTVHRDQTTALSYGTTHERPVAFSDFMADVDSGKVEQVTIAGHELAGIYRTDKERFRT